MPGSSNSRSTPMLSVLWRTSLICLSLLSSPLSSIDLLSIHPCTLVYAPLDHPTAHTQRFPIQRDECKAYRMQRRAASTHREICSLSQCCREKVTADTNSMLAGCLPTVRFGSHTHTLTERGRRKKTTSMSVGSVSTAHKSSSNRCLNPSGPYCLPKVFFTPHNPQPSPRALALCCVLKIYPDIPSFISQFSQIPRQALAEVPGSSGSRRLSRCVSLSREL
jgi:hypothetical protein